MKRVWEKKRNPYPVIVRTLPEGSNPKYVSKCQKCSPWPNKRTLTSYTFLLYLPALSKLLQPQRMSWDTKPKEMAHCKPEPGRCQCGSNRVQNCGATVAEIRRLRDAWWHPRRLLQEGGRRGEQVQLGYRLQVERWAHCWLMISVSTNKGGKSSPESWGQGQGQSGGWR